LNNGPIFENEKNTICTALMGIPLQGTWYCIHALPGGLVTTTRSGEMKCYFKPSIYGH